MYKCTARMDGLASLVTSLGRARARASLRLRMVKDPKSIFGHGLCN